MISEVRLSSDDPNHRITIALNYEELDWLDKGLSALTSSIPDYEYDEYADFYIGVLNTLRDRLGEASSEFE